MNIKQKMLTNTLITGLGLLALLLLLLQESAILKDLSIRVSQAEQLTSHILSLRKYEKDFLARKELTYKDKFDQEALQTINTLEQLQAFYQSINQNSAQLDQLSEQVKLYQQDFDQLVMLNQTLGLDHKSGLHGKLRDSAHELEKHIIELNNDKLLAAYLMVRRSEKDFIQRHDMKYADTLNKQVQALHSQLLPDDAAVLSRFQSQFNQYVTTLNQFGLDHSQGLLGQMRQTIKQTEDVLVAVELNLHQILAQRVDEITQQALFLFIAIMILVIGIGAYISRSVLNPINSLVNVIQNIQQSNNLSLRVEQSGKDELSQLGRSFNLMLSNFQSIIKGVNTAVSELSESSEQLSVNANNNKAQISKQLEETDQVATAVTEMGSTIEEIAKNTEMVAQVAEQTNRNALLGKQSVEDTINKIEQLSAALNSSSQAVSVLAEESQTIDQVLDVIKSIAEQTNLLALNAAIEAARAGEQGRGFAVVADEVRNLAMRTQDSTLEISQIIDSLQQRTQGIVNLISSCHQQGKDSSDQAQQAGELLTQITKDVSHISDMSTQVAAAIEEQSLVSAEVNRNIINIKDSAEHNSASALSSVHASDKVLEQATVLHNAVKQFNL
ncbi:methyl-accepting chemotaxis protein [Motilimonas cestriensis]|uniref:methyl-accepting chemotaxis protein n=1 Tax=Motilimonas cestriensis TaxID=2742685 RepID=UPI003DA45DE7